MRQSGLDAARLHRMPAVVVLAALLPLLAAAACSDEEDGADDLAAWCDAAAELDALQGVDDELHPGAQRIEELEEQVLEDSPEAMALAVRTLFDPLENDRGIDWRRFDAHRSAFDRFMTDECHRATHEETEAFCAAMRELHRRASAEGDVALEEATARALDLAPSDIAADARLVLDSEPPPGGGDDGSSVESVIDYVEMHCRFTPRWMSAP